METITDHKQLTGFTEDSVYRDQSALLTALLPFCPGAKLGYNISTEGGKKYYRGAYVIIQDSPFLIAGSYKKEFTFYSREFPRYAKGFELPTAPNKVYKLSQNAVNNWITYLNTCHGILKEREARKDLEFQAYKTRLTEAGANWYRDMLACYVERNGIELAVSFDVETGHISNKIELRAYPHNLDTFLSLSNNRYKKQ